MYNPESTLAWSKLNHLAELNRNDKIMDYFSDQPGRFEEMSLKVAGVFLDYSKNKISKPVLNELLQLAEQSPLSIRREQMFTGENINASEDRPVLHTALRNMSGSPVFVGDRDIMSDVRSALKSLELFSAKIRDGEWRGSSGKLIKNIVNIGIGGSDLGPKMVCRALADYQHERLKFYFISSVDSAHFKRTLSNLNADETLFIVSSKSFTTQETMINANSCKQWFLDKAPCDQLKMDQHFVAVSASVDAAKEFGIPPSNVFEFWDWVGGRYSLWSSIGLPIILSIGFEGFVDLLEGAHEIDQHFQQSPFKENLPVILALVGIWNVNFLKGHSQAVIPYDRALHCLPAFLQQLDMESNGKLVNREGEIVSYATGPVVWGETGSNGQHAFFQLLHQSSSYIPVDFIASLDQDKNTPEHNNALLINMLAQSQALMLGSGDSIENSYGYCPGNKPSNTILLDNISPKTIGALTAIYEHKVFVQGAIWNINSFDQWGVQLGKELAKEMQSCETKHDSSTQGLLDIVKQHI